MRWRRSASRTFALQRTRAVFTFTAKGNNTLVRLSQTGWQSGKEWDDGLRVSRCRQRGDSRYAAPPLCGWADRLGEDDSSDRKTVWELTAKEKTP